MLIDNYRYIHIYENCSANMLSVNFKGLGPSASQPKSETKTTAQKNSSIKCQNPGIRNPEYNPGN